MLLFFSLYSITEFQWLFSFNVALWPIITSRLFGLVSITLIRRKCAANSEMLPTETVEIIITAFSCPYSTAAVPIVMALKKAASHLALISKACLLYGVTTPMSDSVTAWRDLSVVVSSRIYANTIFASTELKRLKGKLIINSNFQIKYQIANLLSSPVCSQMPFTAWKTTGKCGEGNNSVSINQLVLPGKKDIKVSLKSGKYGTYLTFHNFMKSQITDKKMFKISKNETREWWWMI